MLAYAVLYLSIGLIARLVAAVVVFRQEVRAARHDEMLQVLHPERDVHAERRRAKTLLPLAVGLAFLLLWPLLLLVLTVASAIDFFRRHRQRWSLDRPMPFIRLRIRIKRKSRQRCSPAGSLGRRP